MTADRPIARDLIAGLSVAAVLIPQSFAYAELAGFPAQYGLVAASLPPLAAAAFASSPYLQTGPVALTSLLTLAALGQLAVPFSLEYVQLGSLLALTVGALRVALGGAGAGRFVQLFRPAVLRGFVSAAACLIVASQLPAALGVVGGPAGVLPRAAWALLHPAQWSTLAVGFAAGAAGAVLLGRRIHGLFPGVLVVVVVGTALSAGLGYQGAVVGEFAGGVPFGLPTLALERWPQLLLPALLIAVVGFAEPASVAQHFAAVEGQRWDADRELVGQGIANLVSGAVGGFPVGGSLSRTALGHLAGAQTRASGAIAGLVVLLFLPFVGVVASLPKAVLAGVIGAAVVSLLDPRPLVDLGKASRRDGVVGYSTFVVSLLSAPHVEVGVLVGVLLALVLPDPRRSGDAAPTPR